MLLWRDEGEDRVHARELLARAGRAYRKIGMSRHVRLTEQLTVEALGPGALHGASSSATPDPSA